MTALRIASLVLIVLAMVPALAHALELPGKLRLAKDAYFAVQPIYYPGFTIAGAAEPLAIISSTILVMMTPRASADFWLTLAALAGLIAMHAVYWLLTHPVNNFWLRRERLGGAGAGFFSFHAAASPPSELDDAARPLGILARGSSGARIGELHRAARRRHLG